MEVGGNHFEKQGSEPMIYSCNWMFDMFESVPYFLCDKTDCITF